MPAISFHLRLFRGAFLWRGLELSSSRVSVRVWKKLLLPQKNELQKLLFTCILSVITLVFLCNSCLRVGLLYLGTLVLSDKDG